jgi:hypothetical protein
MVGWFGWACAAAFVVRTQQREMIAGPLLLTLGIALGLGFALLILRGASGLRPQALPLGILEGASTIGVGETEVWLDQAGRSAAIALQAVRRIETCPEGQVLYGDSEALLWLPPGAFPAEVARAFSRAVLAGAGSGQSSSATASSSRGFWIGYLRNLWYGLRAAGFIPPVRGPVDDRPRQGIALAATLVALNVCLQYWTVGPDSEFNLAALPGVLFVIPVLLLAAWCAGALAGAPGRSAESVTLGLAASLYCEPASRLLAEQPRVVAALARLVPEDGLPYALNAAWLGLALAFALWLRLRPKPTRAVLACVSCALILAVPLAVVPYDDAFWTSPAASGDESARASDSPQEEDSSSQAGEERLYREPAVLDAALARLAPPRADRVNLYFVGFAGTSTQDVFMKEVHSIGRLFSDHFQSGSHSLVLVNNPATLDAEPMATRTALASALARIGSVMDPKRDILFLYMTSHGSPDHSFSVSFPPFPLEDIQPEDLRAMLDEAGIQNRVIVVSACYSGGFVEPLKTDSSLIMTAAAADRSSFGCSSEENFTYFGRAYFDEALRSTNSFVEAFRIAAPRIAQRESRQGFLPSEPQIFIGPQIRPILERFEHQLAPQRALANALP